LAKKTDLQSIVKIISEFVQKDQLLATTLFVPMVDEILRSSPLVQVILILTKKNFFKFPKF
jgi:hypothetical protein